MIEGWKFGAIINVTSGAPLNISGRNTLYAAGTPDIVGALPRNGNVVWPASGSIFGGFFSQQYRIRESKRLTFRMDAQNIFNHPTPGNPSLNINSGTFGQITTKTGNRNLQTQIRLDF